MRTARGMIVGIVALVALLAGCGTTSSDTADALVGNWGGPNREVTATTSALIVNLPCMRLTLSGPVHVAPDGAFSATGKISGDASWGTEGTPARATGKISGDQLVLAIEWQNANGAWPPVASTSTLVSDAPATWPQGRYCIQ